MPMYTVREFKSSELRVQGFDIRKQLGQAFTSEYGNHLLMCYGNWKSSASNTRITR